MCTENFSGRSEDGANIQLSVVREVFISRSRGELSFSGRAGPILRSGEDGRNHRKEQRVSISRVIQWLLRYL